MAGHEAHPPLPKLVSILEREISRADARAIGVERSSASKKSQSAGHRLCDLRVHSLWEKHKRGQYSAREVLNACSHVACDPCVSSDDALRCPDLDE